MSNRPLSVPYRGSELLAVPAAHFKHRFAQAVNHCCYDPETRPEAIAVELGPRIVAAAVQWLKEIHVKADGKKGFPVMMGLLKGNRMIKASLRDKALQLQKDTGKDLSELSPKVLHRELGYSGQSLLCLTPTDSIIEALRCAMELNIPVFGVDLDDMADGIYKPVMVQNPDNEEGLISYIGENVYYAECQRDDEIDHRREVVMAARLKTLLEDHHRVLFTCGMAHWRLIKDLLDDTSIKPSVITEVAEKTAGEFRRVIVDPHIAVKYMDSYPVLSTIYEKKRLSINSDSIDKGNYPDIAKIFDGLLKKTYRKYFRSNGGNSGIDRRSEDLDKVGDFEGYIRNLCFLSHQSAPDIFMAVKAAHETMSGEFAQILSNTFMKFPWASPVDFPECNLLSHSSGETGAVVLMKDGHQDGKVFYIRAVNADGSPSGHKIPYDWEEEKEYLKKLSFGLTSHTWRPWDYLISSMSIRAIEAASKKQIVKKAVAFDGNLLEGLDTKGTIRASSRGDERLYVKDYCKENLDCPNPLDRFPIVWIFDPDSHDSAEWIVLQEPCRYMEKYVRDRALFERIAKEYGYNMVATIAYGKRHINDNGSYGHSNIRCDKYYGVILFQPIYFTNRQFARYAEMTGYHRRSPFCNDSSMDNQGYSDLSSYYDKRHGIKVGELHWATTLILLALPFAKDILVVAVPKGYRIEQVVYRKARKYGVVICPVPHNLFAPAHLDRISLCHLVPAISIDPECVYSKEIEKEIGELQMDNRCLIHHWLLDFGNGA